MADWEGGHGHSVTGDRHAALYQDFRVYFTHMATGKTTSFAAILTKFQDAFKSKWDTTEYNGRMDEVAKFKNTARTINFSLDVISDDPSEGANNMERFQRLTRFLYPTYEAPLEKGVTGFGGANTIVSPPLMGVKFGNLIQNRATGAGGDALVGYLDGVTLNPEHQAGWWYANSLDNVGMKPMKHPGKNDAKELAAFKAAGFVDMDDNVAWEAEPVNMGEYKAVYGPIVIPKLFKLDFSFHVLHTHPLGWTQWGEWTLAAEDYPYEAGLLTDVEHEKEGKHKVELEMSYHYNAAVVPGNVELDLIGAILGTN